MHFLKKIIFLLLFIISFSCKTRLEKQGWQRIVVVTQIDTSTIRKNKELVVEKMYNKGSYSYRLNLFEKDSTGKIINKQWGLERWLFKSDIAYYKWEYDSVCLVKFLNQGNVQASFKVSIINDSSERFEILDQPKK